MSNGPISITIHMLNVHVELLSLYHCLFVSFHSRDLPLLVSLGILGMFCNQLFYILGIYYTSANTASIFQPAIPVWTSIVAVVARIEPFPALKTIRGWAKLLGVLCAASGAVVMTMFRDSGGKKNQREGWENGIGYIFLIGNTLAMAIYVVFQKKYVFNAPASRWKASPFALTAWSYVFGFLSMGLASVYYVNKPEKFAIPAQAVYPLIYAVFIASGMCYLLITWCNSMISTSVVTATWPLQVLFCIILAYFVLGETLVGGQGAGGLLIIIGLLAVVWANYKDELEKHDKESGSPCKTSLGSLDTDHLINK